MSEAIRTHLTATDATLDAPPWHLVHFDVRCARCGEDLRGQTDPVCPSCRLVFNWSDAVPLEKLTCAQCGYHLYGLADSRCPECGTGVNWDEALLRHRVREKDLFEYRWRDRPIRSFFRSWYLALRPGRLWREIKMHDPPRLRPLLFWAFVLAFASVFVFPIGYAVIQWATPMWGTPNVRLTMRNAALSGAYWLELLRWVTGSLSNPRLYMPTVVYMWGCLILLCALMVFRQSMRIYKVRTIHVARVWAYSVFALLPWATLGFVVFLGLAEFQSATRNWTRARSFAWMYDSYQYFALAVILHATWSIRQGYRHYLRIPHSLGIAIVTQIMAVLVVVITYTRLIVG